MITLRQSMSEISRFLRQRGVGITRTAMDPLRRLDFAALVEIYDHEERFLRETFLKNLIRAHEARVKGTQRPRKVNVQDIRSAMLMLGTAVSAASENEFSEANKKKIQEICPYC